MAGSIQKLIDRMIYWCQTVSLGYDQSNRLDFRDDGETDCSALVIHALQEAGFSTGSASYTGNMRSNLTARGWKVITNNGAPQAGDILLNDNNHVAVYIGGGKLAQASIDERGKITGGKGGDQTGNETNIRGYYNYPWNCYLRYSGTQTPGKSISEIAKEVIAGKWSTGADRVAKLKAAGYDPVAVQAEVNRQLGAGSSHPSAKWISENGHFKLSKDINLRKEPKATSGLIATLKAGSTIKYNAYCHVNGYVWIRQVRSDGSYGYLATGNSVNGKRQNYWGTFY